MKKIVLLALFALLFFTACSQTISVKALEPAEVDRIASTKKLAISTFSNDAVGLATKIEVILAKHKIDNKNYFTMVSRNDFNKILKEQKIQNSGLIDPSSVVQVGSLMGAQAIISGNVGNVGSKDTRFYENRYKCADKKCKETIVYQVRCTKRVVSLSAEVRIVDVLHGDIIYGDTLNKSAVYKQCSDNSSALPSVETASQNLASSMANSFTYKLLPHYRSFEVTLLEEPDLDYTDDQEKLLEISLEYIEHGRFDKAEQFLTMLIDTTDQQSYVAFYNLGVVKEAEGKYLEAKEYYEAADKLMVEPVEEISRAYLRINSLIAKRDKALMQMRQGVK